MVFKGQSSDYLNVTAGVPQGAILGPLLFLIYVNDFGDKLENESYLFADDSTLLKLYRPCDENLAVESINKDLSISSKWGDTWKLAFNANKSIAINFSLNNKKTNSMPIVLNNSLIQYVSKHKHLGVILSDDLKWSNHIDHVISSTNKKLGLLKRRSFALNRNQKSFVFLNIIRPAIEYGSVLYNNCSVYDSIRLEQLRRRAALICTGALRQTNTKRLLD